MWKKVFLSGINLAWLHFAQDLDDFDHALFAKAMNDTTAAGGNAVRWWLHTNASQNPIFDNGIVTGYNEHNLDNLRRALDLAYDSEISLILCLFSFDLLQEQRGVNHEANKNLVEKRSHTEAYINKVLIPMVEAVKDHPALFAWEIFNEPEGMTAEYGWTPVRTTMGKVQQFVNLTAGAIKRTAPHNLVTNGSWNFRVLTDVDGMYNYYRDDRLTAAGGDPEGILDFYQVHFYPCHFDEKTSPFHHPADYWQLDKPILIGEFPALGIVRHPGQAFRPQTELTAEEAYVYALDNGYMGAISWTWTNHDGNGGVQDAAPGMRRVRAVAPQRLKNAQPRI